MRYDHIWGILLLAAFSPIHLSAQSKAKIQSQIAQVESNLMPAIRFEGDSIWTIEQRMKHYSIPGLSIAVIKDSKIVWMKSYGWMDQAEQKPVTNQSLFQAASISKPLSAYAALKLVESGKIQAEENINTYLKSWKLPDNEFTAAKKVNLKHILSHSGGLTISGFPGYASGVSIPTLKQVLDGESPANTAAIRVDKEPGGYFRYSGGGYTLLQQMLIDMEGKSFPELMQDLVIQPLGMKQSSFNQPLEPKQLKYAGTGYLPAGIEVPGKRHIYPELAAAGLWTTAEDLAKFIIDVQQSIAGKSKKVISQEMAIAFTSPFIEPYEGLGFFLEKRGEQEYFNHGGWNEGFSSKIIGSKYSGDGVAILTNTNQPLFIEELIRAVAATYKWPEYNQQVLKQIPLNAQDIQAIAGRYRIDKFGTLRVFEQGGSLFVENNMEKPNELFKVDQNSYVMREWDFEVRFLVNPEDQKKNFVIVHRDGIIRYLQPLMEEDEKSPFDYIKEGSFDSALAAFFKAKESDASNNILSEGYINGQGYRLLADKKWSQAIDLFRVNTFLYPNSENAFDSLAEAYSASGNHKLAKENYNKVLKINPQNEKAGTAISNL